MAAKTAETEASGLRNVRAIAAFAAFILLGLGIWRASDVFTQPAVGTAAISLEQEKLLHVIEPLTGPGNVRVSVRRSEAGGRDFLVMIDTASSGARDLGQQIEAILGKAAGFNRRTGRYAHGPGIPICRRRARAPGGERTRAARDYGSSGVSAVLGRVCSCAVSASS